MASARKPSFPRYETRASVRPYLSRATDWTRTSWFSTRLDVSWVALSPKGWAFSGASTPWSRIFTPTPSCSTVIVSPSATATTLPFHVAGAARASRHSSSRGIAVAMTLILPSWRFQAAYVK